MKTGRAPLALEGRTTILERMSEMTFIYALVDPRDGRVRYVGKSDDPDRRLRNHLLEVANGHNRNPYFRWWINLLGKDGLTPTVRRIMQCEQAAARDWERHWIWAFRWAGEKLTNLAAGGTGGATRSGAKHSNAALARQRWAHFLRMTFPDIWKEWKEIRAVIYRNDKIARDVRNRIATSKRSKQMPHLWRPGQQPWITGKHWSPEMREKLGRAHLGKAPSNKGKKMGDFQKAKLRAAWRIKKMRADFEGR